MEPKVFVIIVNWNGEDDTVKCLESLLALEYSNCHVLISDNGSRPESIQLLKTWAKNHVSPGGSGICSLEIIENGRNLGFTGANTSGIHAALAQDADYVLFLNNDTFVTPDFLRKMVSAGQSDRTVGVIGCKIFSTDTDQHGRHKIWTLGGYSFSWGIPLNIGSGKLDDPRWTGIKVQPLINGCCMLIKREVIETVGVQDDRLFFGMDDVEYSLRASRYGWKNLVVYDAAIYHAGSQGVAPRSGLQVYYNFRNMLQFRTRHFPWYRNIAFYGFFTFRYLLAGSAYRWLSGRGRVNLGVYYAILDFFCNRTGECPHTATLRGQRQSSKAPEQTSR